MAENKFHLQKVQENLKRVFENELPQKLANQAQNFFTDSFRKQGWDDNGVKLWKEVKRRIPGTPEYKYPKKKGLSRRTSAILVRTGTLRRATSNSIRLVSPQKIQLVISVPYAKYVNDGTNKMVARKFIGDSEALKRKQVELIKREISKGFRI